MSLGFEVAMVIGAAGMGILALPWSAVEVEESRRALGAAAARLWGRRTGAQSLVPAAEPTAPPAPVRLRVSA